MTEKRRTKSKGWGCLSTLFLALLINVFIIAGGYFYINQQLKNASHPIVETSLDSVVESGNESMELILNRTIVNRLFSEMLASMNDNNLGLSINWVDDHISATAQINQNGFQVPADILADVTISNENYLVIEIDSIHVAGIPLPVDSAYEAFASQINLPSGATFSATQPQIILNINQFEGVDPAYTIIPKSVDLANDALVVEIQYDATTHPIIYFN
ncbi:DUF2140 family protein [Fundicoccus culcitae]|uniref:DUF2140 family protein n=1 Tax=Fundicoccus culcitae TaxID=2969821 RepID=A0ABY5P6Q6_9LACT|nr:DUF2140 family protein [Fundicoccus culcitae]UUX34421.1 DUF2140 family protein [Fundicoccus culcitae]